MDGARLRRESRAEIYEEANDRNDNTHGEKKWEEGKGVELLVRWMKKRQRDAMFQNSSSLWSRGGDSRSCED